MSNILSQEEIDTLLGGLNEDDVDDELKAEQARSARNDAIAFDFFSQDRIVRGGMPTLEVIHDRFARLMRTAMTQTVRRAIDVNVMTFADIKYGEFSRTLPTPASLHVIKLEPLKGLGLLVLPGKLIYTLIDIFFGGSGIEADQSGTRDFTLIEQRIISNLTEMIDKQYAEAWRPVSPLRVESAGTETNPQFINIAQASDTVTAVDYEVVIDGEKCGMSICLPYTTIEPLKDILKGSVISENVDGENTWGDSLAIHLQQSVIEMRAMLGSTDITVQDLLDLKVGDVVQLKEDFEHPIEVLVEDVPKFWARVGSHKSTRAIQVTGILNGERK